MVNPVDKLGAAVAALRAQRLAAQRRQQARPGSTKTANAPASQTPAERMAALKHAVTLAVSALDPEADDWRPRARRVFVEQVLQFEFGREIALDPRFAQMVRQVATDLCSDPDSATQLDTQLEGLARKTPGNPSA